MKITLISTSTFPADQGLRTLSACLKREGHKVKMLFLPSSEDYSVYYSQKVLNQIEDITKDNGLVGISAMESTTPRALQLIDMYKKLKVPVVWGGPHPTFFPAKCFKYCDIICVGEAEDAIIELAEKLEKKQDISEIKNLWIRINDKEFKNQVRSPAENLDDLAHPDYDIEDHLILENEKLIPFEEKHLSGMIFFQTERGCPQACTFCTNNILRALYKDKGSLLRTHSVDYVIKELVRLKEKFKSIGFFDLRDETFTVRDIEWIRDFSKRYKEEVGMRFKCLAEPATMSVDNVSEEKIRLLVEAGLTDIIVGIQSGSDRLNFNVYKRFISSKQLLDAAIILSKYSDKLRVMYDVITCNPYETKEDILATINLIRQIPPPFYLSVNNLVLFEGTPLYDQAVKDGFLSQDISETEQLLNYWDRWKHIKKSKNNAYLNLILNLMRGNCTKSKLGLLPRSLLNSLIDEKLVKFNLKHVGPTFTFGRVVQAMDHLRENVAKPVYRSMPVGFKIWYDKVRYRI